VLLRVWGSMVCGGVRVVAYVWGNHRVIPTAGAAVVSGGKVRLQVVG